MKSNEIDITYYDNVVRYHSVNHSKETSLEREWNKIKNIKNTVPNGTSMERGTKKCQNR